MIESINDSAGCGENEQTQMKDYSAIQALNG